MKADVLRITKMYKIRGLRGFEQELWLLKVRRLWNFESVSKIRRRYQNVVHFHFCPTLGLTWLRKLTVCHKQRWSHQRWFEGGRRCRLDIACVSRGRQLEGRRGGVGGILELPTAFYPGLPRPTVLLSQLPVSRINFLLSFNIHTIKGKPRITKNGKKG